MRRLYYTLLEILIVVSIVAVLAATGLGVTSFVRNKIAETQTETTIKLVEMAFQNYHQQNGMYPVVSEDDAPFLAIDLPSFAGLSYDEACREFQKLWIGGFNDITLPSNFPTSKAGLKIRGIRLEYTGGKYYILDGWNRRIFYLNPGVFNSGSYDLISFGADALAGDGSGSTTAVNSFTADKFKQASQYPEQTGDDVTNFTRN